MINILGFVGSLRSGSCNRQLADTAVANVPTGISLELFSGIEGIPYYNEDIDVPGSAPAAASRLRLLTLGADALLFFSPEYNGTMPATVKNVIDWLSRPYGHSAITDKPAAVVGASAGRRGAAWAHDDARKSLEIAGATVLDDATLSIPNAVQVFSNTPPSHDKAIVDKLRLIMCELAAIVPDKDY
ncbi:NAD(P)H-dependent oxidoreductase [Mycobacteroides abscessus subsp. bolletii]|uniref:NAD(P)H-dependent oxidoreductase n=1 Tax=Mycobacteroides abscessus TaxID=36809 RepID=UPI0019D22984|nr:NAD(P)H-dependent oxidoreductase [Mycobacteroides abscessus]MBN7300804.1 NAD(P)H-dependent oxidoreductase [Mycobacteroides abscessus subsp. bolletii]